MTVGVSKVRRRIQLQTLPAVEVYDACMTLKDMAPNWRNEVTIESLDQVREFDPITPIKMMSPAALLVIAEEHDGLLPIAAIKEAFEKAADPRLELSVCGFYEARLSASACTAVIGKCWMRAADARNP